MALMPQTPFQWFVPATTGTGMVPAAGYLVKYYAAGTATPKVIYTDSALSVPYPSPSNTAVLDSAGRALIYLGAGGYKMVVCRPDGTPVYTQDNIAGESSFGTGFVSSFAALAGVDTNLNPYTYVGGYYIPGDGGEGMFYNQTSGAAADGGYVQASTFDTAKKWFRIPDENGDARAASFGFCGSGDKTSNLIAADAYAVSSNARLRVQVDPCTTGTATLSAPTIVFNQDAAFYAIGTANLVVNGIIEAGGWRLFSGFASVTLANAKQESRPEWFGASLTASAGDNNTAFDKWKAAGAGVFVVPAGSWPHSGGFTPVADKITIFIGSVDTRPSGTFYGPTSLLSGNLFLTLTGEFGFTGPLTLTGAATIAGNVDQTGTFNLTGNLVASGPITGASLSSEDYVTASGPITTTDSVAAVKDVVAGASSGSVGSLYARSGSSTKSFKASGLIFSSTNTLTYSLPANALLADQDSLDLELMVDKTSTSGDVTVVSSIGGAQTFNKTIAGLSSAGVYLRMGISRTGTTAFASGGIMGGGILSVADVKTGSATWSNTNNIVFSVSTTAGTVTVRHVKITVQEAS